MNDTAFNSVVLQDYLDRWQAGDRAAADELLHVAGARLEKLARRMCRSFPNVREWAETSDVLQNSLIRLLRTLQNMRPKTTRDFFNLAAVHIRRELLDLARHFRVRGWVPLEVHIGSTDPRNGRPRSASSPIGPVGGNFIAGSSTSPLDVQCATCPFTTTTTSFQSWGLYIFSSLYGPATR